MTETLDYVGLQAKLQPSVCAARDLTTGAHWTYAQFDRTVSKFAALLQRFSIVTELPRNGAGKVLKAALRAVLRRAEWTSHFDLRSNGSDHAVHYCA